VKNKRSLHPQEAAYELGVSTKTIHRWDEAGKLRKVRTIGNQRRIPIEEVWRLHVPEKRAERCVLYARVSSVRQEQDGNLARQMARLWEAAASHGYEVVQTITEQASSLNERRKGMKQLLSLIGEQAGCMAIEPKVYANEWKPCGSEYEQEEETDGAGKPHHEAAP
jgi:putative resolvase